MLSITNVVLLGNFEREINLDQLYASIPVVKSSSKKIKDVPYLGVEEVIVNKSFNTLSEGLRAAEGKMKQLLTLDIQFNKKNNHVKISKNKFHITGMKSVTEGRNIIDFTIKFINRLHDEINYIYNKEYDCEEVEEINIMLSHTSVRSIDKVRPFMEEYIVDCKYSIQNIMYNYRHSYIFDIIAAGQLVKEKFPQIVLEYNNFSSAQEIRLQNIPIDNKITDIKITMYMKGSMTLTSKLDVKIIQEFFKYIIYLIDTLEA